jgi:hypothetical protein
MDHRQVGRGVNAAASGLEFGPLVSARRILSDARSSVLSAYDAKAQEALASMAEYVARFLTAPHPELGRPGAICPFAATAVERDHVQLTACAVEGHGPIAEGCVAAGMAELRAALANSPDGRPSHQAIIAVFPRLTEPEGARMIERVQRALKLSFIQRSLMIGQFYPSCPEPGLWSADFRPLQSPVISLAIRDITIFDAPFMLERQDCIDAYLHIFGEAGAERIANARRERNAPGRGGCPAEASKAAAGR